MSLGYLTLTRVSWLPYAHKYLLVTLPSQIPVGYLTLINTRWLSHPHKCLLVTLPSPGPMSKLKEYLQYLVEVTQTAVTTRRVLTLLVIVPSPVSPGYLTLTDACWLPYPHNYLLITLPSHMSVGDLTLTHVCW